MKIDLPPLLFSPDFYEGILLAVGLALLRKTYQLFQAPSLEAMEETATKPMKHVGDDKKITVYGFEEQGQHRDYKKGIADASPYAARVEAFLRLLGLEYTKAQCVPDTGENPRLKLPYANIYGKMVDDSSRIIEHLKVVTGKDPDVDLTREQWATGQLVRETVFGNLYWFLMYRTFATENGRVVFSATMSERLPPVLDKLVSAMVFRMLYGYLSAVGLALLPYKEVVQKGQNSLRALSKTLGSKKFILGTKSATTYDIDCYPTLARFFYDDAHAEVIQEIQVECQNLKNYTDRMKDLLYPELKDS